MSAADTPNMPEGDGEAEVGRRVLLRGMAAMGLAAVTVPLAACGSDDEPGAAAQSTPEPSVEATPQATPAGTASTPKASPKSASSTPPSPAAPTTSASATSVASSS